MFYLLDMVKYKKMCSATVVGYSTDLKNLKNLNFENLTFVTFRQLTIKGQLES